MAIEQTKIVDSVSIDNKRREVGLNLTDALGWEPGTEIKHLQLLKDKIDAYVYFIESGQLKKDAEFPSDYTVVIRVVAKYPFPKLSDAFRNSVTDVLETAGHRIVFLTIEEFERIYQKRIH